MTVFTKLKLIYRILRWRLTWEKRDTHFIYHVPGNPKFMGAREAIGFIPDGAFVTVSGLGGNQHATILYWAMKELYAETKHPRDLTLMSIGGQGGRGKVPGTVDELGVEGLTTKFITGHHETFKNFLRLGEAGKVELQCLPQGTLALLIEAQARGESSLLVSTGVGTAFDPSTGRGTPLTPGGEQLAAREGDKVRFRVPKIDVALINAPAADKLGNVYMKNTSMLAESREIALAARRNGGKVIVVVGKLVDKGYDDVYFTPDAVDAIVYYPDTGQTLSRKHTKPWMALTTHSDIGVMDAYAQMRFVNRVIGVTPRRTPVDEAMARLAALVFAQNVPQGALVNIGTGLPEEVCRTLVEGGLLDKITFFTESGVVGGLPGPGVFFGAAASPHYMISSAEIFHKAHSELDVTILGTLQVDSKGDVNVSKRGPNITNYVGPGGFIDFSTSAKTIIFVGNWMAHGQMQIENGRIKILKHGVPKFVEAVDEITFCGAEALRAGRKVFYVTPVGVFRLTERGLELQTVMPGVDVKRDILDYAKARILIPQGKVPEVDPSVITGDGFRLRMG